MEALRNPSNTVSDRFLPRTEGTRSCEECGGRVEGSTCIRCGLVRDGPVIFEHGASVDPVVALRHSYPLKTDNERDGKRWRKDDCIRIAANFGFILSFRDVPKSGRVSDLLLLLLERMINDSRNRSRSVRLTESMYSVSDAAPILGLRVETVRERIRRGAISAESDPTGRYRIPRDEIVRALRRAENHGIWFRFRQKVKEIGITVRDRDMVPGLERLGLPVPERPFRTRRRTRRKP